MSLFFLNPDNEFDSIVSVLKIFHFLATELLKEFSNVESNSSFIQV